MAGAYQRADLFTFFTLPNLLLLIALQIPDDDQPNAIQAWKQRRYTEKQHHVQCPEESDRKFSQDKVTQMLYAI